MNTERPDPPVTPGLDGLVPESPAASSSPAWLEWAKSLQAMAQTGLAYTRDPWDRERYLTITAIAHAMMARGCGVPLPDVARSLGQDQGHATPKLDVRTAVFRVIDGRDCVLLVREQRDGCWTLPGGWAEVGETPASAAARETREEAGAEVEITRLLAFWDNHQQGHPPSPWYICKAVFLGELRQGEPLGGDGRETDAVAFHPCDALPPLSLGRILPAQVRRLAKLWRSGPEAPTLFD